MVAQQVSCLHRGHRKQPPRAVNSPPPFTTLLNGIISRSWLSTPLCQYLYLYLWAVATVLFINPPFVAHTALLQYDNHAESGSVTSGESKYSGVSLVVSILVIA